MIFDINSLLNRNQEQEKQRITQRVTKDISTHMNTLYESFIKHCKDLVGNAWRSHLSKVESAKALETVLGHELHDIDFQEWLARKIGLSNSEQLVYLLKYAEDKTEQRRRNKLPINVRQDVYDIWKANSNVSIHCSNDWYLVTISADNFESSDIHDNDISLLDKGKVQGHRLVTTKPYCRLHEIYCQVSEFQPLFSSFINLKPLYVSSWTNKKSEMCLCSKCLNPHCIYKALKNSVKEIELPHSLT